MIFNCAICEKDFDETDEDFIALGKKDPEMFCDPCVKEMYDKAKKYYITEKM